MLNNDPFSQWLNIHPLSIHPGSVTLLMNVRNEMLNGFSIAHGGIYFSLADSAIAFAANGYGPMCKTVQSNINFVKSVQVSGQLKAVATELSRGRRTGVYKCEVISDQAELLASVTATVHISSKNWSSVLE